jgi:hypothetical protein
MQTETIETQRIMTADQLEIGKVYLLGKDRMPGIYVGLSKDEPAFIISYSIYSEVRTRELKIGSIDFAVARNPLITRNEHSTSVNGDGGRWDHKWHYNHGKTKSEFENLVKRIKLILNQNGR